MTDQPDPPGPHMQRPFNLFLPGTVCLPPFPSRGQLSLDTLQLSFGSETIVDAPQLTIVHHIGPAKTVSWRIRFELVSALFLPQTDTAQWDQDEWIFLPTHLNSEVREGLIHRLTNRGTVSGFAFVPEDAPLVTVVEKGSTAAEAWEVKGCDCDERAFSYENIVQS